MHLNRSNFLLKWNSHTKKNFFVTEISHKLHSDRFARENKKKTWNAVRRKNIFVSLSLARYTLTKIIDSELFWSEKKQQQIVRGKKSVENYINH